MVKLRTVPEVVSHTESNDVSERQGAFRCSLRPLEVHFRACEREPQSWKEEVCSIARSLVNDAGARPIIVCSGGGMGSEIVCQTLYEEGVNFSVLSVEHNAGTNRADIAFARKWCHERGVKQRIVSLDMSDFFLHAIDRYIDEGYVAGNVLRYLQIFLLETVEQSGGYAVMGGGKQLYDVGEVTSPVEKDVYLEFKSDFTVVLEWMKRNGVTHRPYFYYSTPEATLAYLQIPVVDFAVRNPTVFLHPANKYLFKRLVYQSTWPNLPARRKTGGQESFAGLLRDTQERLRIRFEDVLQTFRLPAVQLRQQLEKTQTKSLPGS